MCVPLWVSQAAFDRRLINCCQRPLPPSGAIDKTEYVVHLGGQQAEFPSFYPQP